MCLSTRPHIILTPIKYKERHDRIGHLFIGKHVNTVIYGNLKNDINTIQNQ